MAAWVSSLYARLADARREPLPSPGKFEELHRRAQNVFTTHYMFDGMKVDFSKGLSPHFQLNHAFHLGSHAVPSSYTFGAVFAHDAQTMMHGMLDTEGALHGRLSYGVSPELTCKANVQISPAQGAMLQTEVDYAGSDWAANAKAVNPSPLDATGILVCSYLQSVSPRCAVGVECVAQRPQPGMEDAALSWAARYTLPRFVLGELPSLGPNEPVPLPPAADPVLTATLQSAQALHVSYVHPVSAKCELASELQVVATPRGREGVAAIAAKYEFRQSTFRTQIDTNGRVASVLEQRMGPIGFTLAGEIDHAKAASRFGFGVMIETM